MLSSKLHIIQILRLFAITALEAIKFHEDKTYKNEAYAKIAGMSLKRLNDLESHFLEALDFRVFITEEVYKDYGRRIISFARAQAA